MTCRSLTLFYCSNPSERPTADVLLSQHPFCEIDPNYSFYDTELFAKIRGTFTN